MRRLLAIVLFVASASAAEAPLTEWGKGPAQWLMTREEQRAWRSVKTEDQARDFIDLFWARRDPTPGTSLNETRGEIEGRIQYADRNFKEGNRRGSLTERGRVLILLGFPKNLSEESEKRSSQYLAPGTDPSMDATGGRQQAARAVWEYDHDRAVVYGMPKIDVVYIHDDFHNTWNRDPSRTDFTSALPNAIAYYIKNPQLTSVPDWASSRVKNDTVTVPMAASEPPPPAAAVMTPAPAVVAPPKPAAPEPKAAGVGQLMLVHDAFSINAQTGEDPFAKLANVGKFTRSDELGWAFQYCTGTATTDLQNVSVALKISGMVKGERINFKTPPEDLSPDSIKNSPGCYVVRGAVPLSELDPGSYTLTVTLAGKDGQQGYNLTRDFTLE